MKQATKKILEAALELPDKEKIQFVEELLVGIEEEPDPDAEAAWADEIARRTHEIEQGTVKPVPWSKVRSWPLSDSGEQDDLAFHPKASEEYMEALGWYTQCPNILDKGLNRR